MTIRTQEDEEYFQLTPKMWQHPTGCLIIGLPSVNQDRITDLYKLKPGAEPPSTLEDFAQLDLNDNVVHLDKASCRTKARSLNTPQWEEASQ